MNSVKNKPILIIYRYTESWKNFTYATMYDDISYSKNFTALYTL